MLGGAKLPDFSAIRILVVGDVMLDRYWIGEVNRISPEAPVPILAVNHSEERAGGAANVARNATSLGAQCRLLSVIGMDNAGQDLKRILKDLDIAANLIEDENATTTIKLRMLSKNQQLIRADFEGQSTDELLARCLDSYHSMLTETDVVILSDYGKGGLTHVIDMISIAQDRNIPVFIDPKGDDFSKYRRASLITPNLKEFKAIVGDVGNDEQLAQKAHELIEQLDLAALLVTLSERGMQLFTRDGQTFASPAHSLEVYDVSGAGDTVIASMAVARAAGLDFHQSMQIANAAAGIVVGKLGAAVATRDELNDFMEMYQ